MSVLNPKQAAFTAALAKATGLNPKVIAAWTLAEESGSAASQRAAQSNNNWLNIGYYDSGAGKLAHDKLFSTPESAAAATADFLRGKRWGAAQGIQDILKTVGKGPAAQMAAITNSPWASSHYKNSGGLRNTFKSVTGEQLPDTTALPLPDGTPSTVPAPAGPSLLPVTNMSPRTTPAAQPLTGGLTAGSFMEAALQTLGVKRHSSLGAQEARTSTQAAGVAPVSLLPLPDGTTSTVTSPTMPGKDTPGVKLTPGGGWQGSQALATSLAKIAEGLGLKPTSEKRDRKLTASGNPSDHWVGSKGSYAYDLSNGVKTPQEDKAATALAAALGVKDYHGGSWLNVTKNGYRYQVGWRVPGHYDHVHVGVRKV